MASTVTMEDDISKISGDPVGKVCPARVQALKALLLSEGSSLSLSFPTNMNSYVYI